MCRWWDYLRDAPVDSWVGTYGKDNANAGVSQTYLTADTDVGVMDEVLRSAAIREDMLRLLFDGADGVSRRRAWAYTCMGAAGTHLEDGFLKFVHFMVSQCIVATCMQVQYTTECIHTVW